MQIQDQNIASVISTKVHSHYTEPDKCFFVGNMEKVLAVAIKINLETSWNPHKDKNLETSF